MKPDGDIILITGANGRIGTAVMRELRKTFSNVVGFDLQSPPDPPEGCTRIPVDITSYSSVTEGLRILRAHHGDRIASVIHLAAYYDFIGKPSPMYDNVTVNGTRRLLAGLRVGFDVQQFVFSSTMLVHKPGEPGIFITEDWPIGPTWAYPESKVRTEAMIAAERGGVPTVMLRFAGVYDDGCHSPPLAHQIQRIHERQLESHLYAGSTSHGTAYVHMDDVVEAIARTVARRARLAAETVILIGEPDTLSYDELQHSFMRQIHDESYEEFSVPGPIAKIGAWVEDNVLGQKPFIKPWMIDRANDHYALDPSRAKRLLGWIPKHTLRKTIPKMVAALKADPLAFYRENGLEPAEWMLANAEAAKQEQRQ
jgi:nucleoside-diphosphate-sugar epimerase